MLRVVGLADVVKLGGGVGTVSGTGVPVPSDMVTQMPPLTLVFLQPVWKLIVIVEVVTTV